MLTWYGGVTCAEPPPMSTVHDEVEDAVGRRAGALRLEPVGHHEPVPAPRLLEDVDDHVPLLCRGDAVDVVVRGHYWPGIGFRDGDLEGQQVDLAQRHLV